MISPATALFSFFAVCVIVYLIFRPNKGWYWFIRKNIRSDKKVIIEDVLKMLYHAENAGKNIVSNQLFNGIKANKKRLLEVIQKMESENLIVSEGDIINLSKAGREYAVMVVRAHRLWEKYLSEQTGYDKLEWHDRAEEMEHSLSKEAINKLALQLGNPRFDPHGDPIPSVDGDMPQLTGKPLTSFTQGVVGTITHIEDEPEEIYKQILAEDLHIGSQITLGKADDNKICFTSEGNTYRLSPIVAANITIKELSKGDAIPETYMRLSNLREGEKAIVKGISQECKGENRRRLLDLGIVPGTTISIDLTSPMKNPKAYLIRNTVIAIRNEQAALILIDKQNNND